MVVTVASAHMFQMLSSPHRRSTAYGERIDITANEMSTLHGMGLSRLTLKPGGVREPHWHPNAHELGYCVRGKGLMTIFGPGSNHNSLILTPGVLSMVPMGTLHHIENTGDELLELLICFNHERFDEINLSSSIGITPDGVMEATFQQPSSFFAKFPRSVEAAFITHREGVAVPSLESETNPYCFDVDAIIPQMQNAGGWVKKSNSFLFPKLEGLAMYGLSLTREGIREPHWHPNAAELNVLLRGRAHISLLSPDGHVDSFDMAPGDISFMPKGYYHYIDNIGDEEVFFAIFFNHPSPSDIGLSGCLGAYSNEVLASLFGCKPGDLAQLPKYQHNLLVVKGGG